MIGNIVGALPMAALWDGLQRRAWPESTLQRLTESLPRRGPVASFEQSWRNERSTMVHEFGAIPRLASEGVSMERLPGWMLASWLDWQRVGCVRLMQPSLDVAQAARTPALRDRLHQADEAIRRLPDRPLDWLAASAVPHVEKLFPNLLHREAQLDLARTAIAIERYRLAHDTLPATLAALVPAYLPAVPTDVIDGTPLHYRPDPDGRGFNLYSVGLDGDDDGGRPAAGRPAALFSAETNGDLVWPRYLPSRPAPTS